jgi:ABC-type uncharacterized transport system auxiliary subunit
MTCRYVINVSLFLLLAPLLAGCMGQSTPTSPIYYYTVDYEPTPATYDAPLPWVLRVHRFSVSPPFNSQRIIYADKGLHRNGYGYHQWIASPGELLPYLLARDMRHTNGFRAVLTPDDTLVATHDLYGWVETFVEQDNTDPRQAFARLHITLVSASDPDPSRRILLQKSYQAHAICNGNTPGDLAQAMSSAVAEINGTVIQDLYHRLESNQPNNP